MAKKAWRAGAYRHRRRLTRTKDIVLTVCFLSLLVLLALRLQGGEEGEVVLGPFYVIDGDTLAKGGERFRLTGIDAPELQQTCEDANGAEWQCGGEARATLQNLLARGEAECRGSQLDQYRRRLVTCFVGNQNLNGLMVRGGMAISTELFTYRREQLAAENHKRGIWQGRFESPKTWRERTKTTDHGKNFEALWQELTDW